MNLFVKLKDENDAQIEKFIELFKDSSVIKLNLPFGQKTKFGWHVILNEGKRKVKPLSLAESKEKIRTQLTHELAGDLLDELRKTAKVKMYNFDGSSLGDKAQ